MPKLIYTPKALDDLQKIKAYVAKQFDEGKAKACVKEITSTVKQLGLFQGEGPCLETYRISNGLPISGCKA